MIPIGFDGANSVLTAPPGVVDCEPLPVDDDGTQLLSCWRPTWRERISMLIFGRVWLCVLGRTHPQVWIKAHANIYITKGDAEIEEED